MLRAPYQSDSASSWSQNPFPRSMDRIDGREGPSHLAREAALDEEFIALDTRIRMLHLWSTGVRELSSSVKLDWCIACLADVRSALFQLHLGVTGEHLPLAPHGPAIVAYLSEAYVWCGDVLDDVRAVVEQLRGGAPRRLPAIADDSSAYIEEFLGPLFLEMCASCREPPADSASTRAFLPLAERLQVAIVSLNWVLRAA
jgi:hypothetical protein